MKDPVFSGRDVADAVRNASRTLSLRENELRYVVLEREQPGGRGLSPTEARIAVLLDAGRAVQRPAITPAEVEPSPEADPPAVTSKGDPEEGLRALLTELGRALGAELHLTLEHDRETLSVRLSGPAVGALLDPEGETLAALEHLIERAFGRAFDARRIRVSGHGFREYRDEWLRRRAQELASEVRASGRPQQFGPLNSYERRVVHIALEGQDAVTTFSVGEGRERRVTVAPRQAPASSPAPAATPPAREKPAVTTPGVPEPQVAEAIRANSTAQPGDPRPQLPQHVQSSAVVAPLATSTTIDLRPYHRPPEGGGTPELM